MGSKIEAPLRIKKVKKKLLLLKLSRYFIYLDNLDCDKTILMPMKSSSSILLCAASLLFVSCQGMKLPWAKTADTATQDASNQWAQGGTYQNQYSQPQQQDWSQPQQNWAQQGQPQQNWSSNDGAQAYPAGAAVGGNNAAGNGWDASGSQDWSQASQQAANSSYKPTSSGGGTRYTVRKGDTLYRIASNNGTTVTKLMASNSLSNANMIRIGQTLRIP
jgi:nucleoid-associated protein YgaU